MYCPVKSIHTPYTYRYTYVFTSYILYKLLRYNVYDIYSTLSELIELKSLLKNPSPTSESLVRAEKFARSCLDSPQLQEISSDPQFKDFPISSILQTVDTYRKDKKDFSVFLQFFNHVLCVYMKDDAFQLPQSVTESLFQLASSLYGESTKDENVTSLYLLVRLTLQTQMNLFPDFYLLLTLFQNK